MPITIELDIRGMPTTSSECGELAKRADQAGQYGLGAYMYGMYFLIEASRMKNPRPQAERLVLSWCQFTRALQYDDRPDSCLDLFIPHVVKLLKLGMEPRVWPDDIEGPLKQQLNKAMSRKRILSISEKAVNAFTDLREVFELHAIADAEGLDTSLFQDDWCLPVIDRHLDYWLEQLFFIEMKIAENAV